MPCNSSSFCSQCIQNDKFSNKQQNLAYQNKEPVTNAFEKILGVITSIASSILPTPIKKTILELDLLELRRMAVCLQSLSVIITELII